MEITKQSSSIVEIIYDPKTRKPRARFGHGWVRFPKKLRIYGRRYQIETMKPGKGGSWIASGRISDLS